MGCELLTHSPTTLFLIFNWAQNTPPAVREAIFSQARETLPVKHVGTPEEIAEAYIFAMKCAYFTGQSIVLDGGHMLL